MSRSVFQATIIIMLVNLLSKILGFVRETIIAREYGASYLTDAYNAAYTLPYFLQAVLGIALVTSIVPVVTKYIVLGREEEAWRIASITLNWSLLLMTAFSLLGMLSAQVLVGLLTPGFSATTAGLTAFLMVIMFPSLIFMSAGMIFTGILNARKRFALAAFAPALSNLVIISSVLFLGRYGISYLAWGTLFGFVGAMLIQWPALRKVGFRYTWDWEWRHPEVKGLFLNLLPIFLGTAVNQIYLAINRYFASGLSEGSISALNYAGKLMTLPLGIFVLAVSSAIFPTLAEHAVKSERQALSATLAKGIKIVLLVSLPASAGLIALRTPIVRLLFERGAFDSVATAMTADALLYFSLGMFAIAANMVITRAYYALGNVKTPLIIGLTSILVNIIASILLVARMGHSGLALANTLATVFSVLLLYGLLKIHLPLLHLKALLISIVKSLIASLLTAGGALTTYHYLCTHVFKETSGKAQLMGILIGISVGLTVYVLSIVILRETEVLSLIKKLQEKRGFIKG